jgi:hypothetical protein
MGVGWTFGHDNVPVMVRFSNTCDQHREHLRNEPRFYELEEGRNADVANIYDQKLAESFEKLGGRGCRSKHISEEVFSWSVAEKLSLLGGLIDSDGCQDKNGSIRIVGTNERLMMDARRLCLSLGIAATISSYISNSGYSENTEVFQVALPGSASSRLSDYSEKVGAVSKSSGTAAVFLKDYVLFPVQSVERYEDELTVFNLQVAEDESYTVQTAAVHNCTICKHKSKTRHDYCKCITEFGMGLILKDGRRVGVINTYPRFFDISFVFIGADKTAKVMCKLGSGLIVPLSAVEKTTPW